MRRLLGSVLLIILVSTACGSDVVEVTSGDGASPDTSMQVPDTTETPPDVVDDGGDQEVERTKLENARDLWSAAGVTDYSFSYGMLCECDLGPWTINVADGEFVGVADDIRVNPTYKTIDDVFDQIDATITEGRVPVRVTYDPDSGVPTEFVWNEPELAVDGGFIWTLQGFDMVDAAP